MSLKLNSCLLFLVWLCMVLGLHAQGLYLGCYGDGNNAGGRAMTNWNGISTNTIGDCYQYAVCHNYAYFALANHGECWYSNNLQQAKSFGTSNICTAECTSNPTEVCGGVWAISLYQTAPAVQQGVYLGCYGDGRNAGGRAMTNWNGISTSTIGECYSYAVSNGYEYFALANHGECWVSNDLHQAESFGVSNICTSVCTSDPTRFCGGWFAISLYQTNH